MKIAVLAPIAWRTPPQHYGPWEQVASNLTESLVNLGHEVTLFATGDSVTSAKLSATTAKGYAEDDTLDVKVEECLHISALMEHAADFDIIHNHFDFLPLTYSKLIKTPMVTTIHGFSSAKIIPVYQKYNPFTAYISISNADRCATLDYLATVYNGLNTSDFSFNPIPQDYLLFLGRIHKDKGTATAIEIAIKSGKKLLIAGIIQDQAYYNESVKPYLSEDIQYLGAAGPEQRNHLIGNAIAMLHPIQFDEPFGLSVAESMLCGTPVIAFNRGAMPELIKNEETGYLVNDVVEAVAAVEKIAGIDRLACHQWAKNSFSKEKMAADYVNCYHQILNK